MNVNRTFDSIVIIIDSMRTVVGDGKDLGKEGRAVLNEGEAPEPTAAPLALRVVPLVHGPEFPRRDPVWLVHDPEFLRRDPEFPPSGPGWQRLVPAVH